MVSHGCCRCQNQTHQEGLLVGWAKTPQESPATPAVWHPFFAHSWSMLGQVFCADLPLSHRHKRIATACLSLSRQTVRSSAELQLETSAEGDEFWPKGSNISNMKQLIMGVTGWCWAIAKGTLLVKLSIEAQLGTVIWSDILSGSQSQFHETCTIHSGSLRYCTRAESGKQSRHSAFRQVTHEQTLTTKFLQIWHLCRIQGAVEPISQGQTDETGQIHIQVLDEMVPKNQSLEVLRETNLIQPLIKIETEAQASQIPGEVHTVQRAVEVVPKAQALKSVWQNLSDHGSKPVEAKQITPAPVQQENEPEWTVDLVDLVDIVWCFPCAKVTNVVISLNAKELCDSSCSWRLPQRSNCGVQMAALHSPGFG